MLRVEHVKRLIEQTGTAQALYCGLTTGAEYVGPKSMRARCPFGDHDELVLQFSVEKLWWKCGGTPSCGFGDIFSFIIRQQEKETGTKQGFGWALVVVCDLIRGLGHELPQEMAFVVSRLLGDSAYERGSLPLPRQAAAPPPTSRKPKSAPVASLPLDDAILVILAAGPHTTRHLRDKLRRGRPEVKAALDSMQQQGLIHRMWHPDRRGRMNRFGAWTLGPLPVGPGG